MPDRLTDADLERIAAKAAEEISLDDHMIVREGPYPFEPEDVAALVAEVRAHRAEANSRLLTPPGFDPPRCPHCNEVTTVVVSEGLPGTFGAVGSVPLWECPNGHQWPFIRAHKETTNAE